MKTNKLLTFLLLIIFSGSLFAASLGELKQDGQIGEMSNGYIGLVNSNVPADVKQLVSEVNAKRKAIYKKQALKNKLTLIEIEKIAGKRNIGKTKAGNYIKSASGWVKK